MRKYRKEPVAYDSIKEEKTMANTCYMCGHEMVEGNDCCPHYEHIIPNALGGHLTSNTILCKKCGTDFSVGAALS